MSPRAQEEVASDAQGLRQPPKAPKGWRPHPGLELRDGRGLEPRPIGKLGLAKLQGSPLLPEPVSKGEHNDGAGPYPSRSVDDAADALHLQQFQRPGR